MLIEATYRIATPAFVSGADQKKAELRLPSFKGLLRFWWRSLAWSSGLHRVEDLWAAEAKIFGSSAEGIGRSPFIMRLTIDNHRRDISRSGDVTKRASGINGKGTAYLGHPIVDVSKSPSRPWLRPGLSFTVRLRARPKSGLKESDVSLLLRALRMVGVVGGIGSRSRNGYGSLTITKLKLDCEERTIRTDPESELRELLNCVGPGEPPWTAWSRESRVVIVEPRGESLNPMRLLDAIGREMIRYRSWGRRGKILSGVDSEKNFKDDHDLMLKAKGRRKRHPDRIVFGLPHNYWFSSTKKSYAVKPAYGLSRRASPLFIHIHQRSDVDPPIGVLAFLPATFLPTNMKSIQVDSEEVDLKGVKDGLWDPINGFLDRFIDGAKEPLTGKEVEFV